MITLINASAFRSEEGRSREMTPEEGQSHLAPYAGSKVRLWAYHCSLSRLVLRVDRPTSHGLPPIDLGFVGVSDIRCPVYWLLGPIEICPDTDSSNTVFEIPSAAVSISASSLIIVVQDEYPHKMWELEPERFT